MSLPVIYQQRPIYKRRLVYQYKMTHSMMTVAQENYFAVEEGQPQIL